MNLCFVLCDLETRLETRPYGSQPVARGPKVARQALKSGPRPPK